MGKYKKNSRFVKFWLPIKKAIWIYKGIMNSGTISDPQAEYLKDQLEKELKKTTGYEG